MRTRGENALLRADGPWENGSVESFNRAFRDGLQEREIFYPLRQGQPLTERRRREWKKVRLDGSLGRRPSLPRTIMPTSPGFAPLRPAAMPLSST